MGQITYSYTYKRSATDVSTLPKDCTEDDIRTLRREIIDCLEYLQEDMGLNVAGVLAAVKNDTPGIMPVVITTANSLDDNDDAVISLMADCAAKIMAAEKILIRR